MLFSETEIEAAVDDTGANGRQNGEHLRISPLRPTTGFWLRWFAIFRAERVVLAPTRVLPL